MTPSELRTICDSLNPGGQSKLARMLPVNDRTVRRWLSGERPIHQAMVARIRDLTEHLPSIENRSKPDIAAG